MNSKIRKYLREQLGTELYAVVRDGLRLAPSRRIPILVKGPQVPTGKSTLVEVLRSIGYPAVEEWEFLEVTLDKRLEKPNSNFLKGLLS